MSFLSKLALKLDNLTELIGKMASWLAIALMAVIVADVVLRRYFVIGSSSLQELEWHLHGALFLLCMGFAYVRGSHVRIELFREKWSDKTKITIELLSIVFLLIPFCLALLKFGFDYTAMSYANSEKSASATGLGALWFIKGVMVFGVLVLLLPAVANLIKCILWLSGSSNLDHQALNSVLSDETDTA